MNSIKTTQIHLMIGMLDCRPRASRMPRGKDSDTQTTPSIRLIMNPPISREATASIASTFSIGAVT